MSSRSDPYRLTTSRARTTNTGRPTSSIAHRLRSVVEHTGRQFTAPEHTLAGQAGRADVAAVLAYARAAADVEQEQVDASSAVLDMARPYFDRLGADHTLGDVRGLMPASDLPRRRYRAAGATTCHWIHRLR